MSGLQHIRRCLIGGPAAALLLTACVPHVEIEGAPCPCPSEYLCCETLAACVATRDQCPDRYPPSSAAPCRSDSECLFNEVCQSWSGEGGKAAGPGQCRRSCTTSIPCAEGESCELTPHDGQPLASMALLRACIPPTPAEGCPEVGCKACTEEQVGKVFCGGVTIMGCFITLNDRCGLTCELVTLQDCYPGQCDATGAAVECKGIYGIDLCTEYPCSECAQSLAPGGSVCDGDQVVGCATLPYPGEVCDQICKPQSTPCPAGMTCRDEDGAHCAY